MYIWIFTKAICAKMNKIYSNSKLLCSHYTEEPKAKGLQEKGTYIREEGPEKDNEKWTREAIDRACIM